MDVLYLTKKKIRFGCNRRPRGVAAAPDTFYGVPGDFDKETGAMPSLGCSFHLQLMPREITAHTTVWTRLLMKMVLILQDKAMLSVVSFRRSKHVNHASLLLYFCCFSFFKCMNGYLKIN